MAEFVQRYGTADHLILGHAPASRGPLSDQMAEHENLRLALCEWESRLSPEHVISAESLLDRYARSSSASSRRPAAVLSPGSTEDVAAIVKIARRHRVPLYPISTGLNWGYGDACAVFPDQVVVDLRRM
ncbi:MAG: FAD-binding protein, partial [Burkholderiales bacterium]